MKRGVPALFVLWFCFASLAGADSLKLTNGQIIYGIFMGRQNDAVQFIATPRAASEVRPDEEGAADDVGGAIFSVGKSD
jgi:hypothetical protein